MKSHGEMVTSECCCIGGIQVKLPSIFDPKSGQGKNEQVIGVPVVRMPQHLPSVDTNNGEGTGASRGIHSEGR
jgi:hypothetical protein